jgi:hypothetical protein
MLRRSASRGQLGTIGSAALERIQLGMGQGGTLHESWERRRPLGRCRDVRRGVRAAADGQGGYGDHGDDQRRGKQIEGGTPRRDHMILPAIGISVVVDHAIDVVAGTASARAGSRHLAARRFNTA